MKYVLQFVGARKQFMLEEWKAGEEKQTALVFIGKNFATKELEKGLSACEI
jgi:G3E family GTPase